MRDEQKYAYIVDMTTDYNKDKSLILDLTQRISELKQQLADKDEEIKELTECNQYLQIYKNKDKISFCIEKLEWVQKLLIDNTFNDLRVVIGEINNQIEELKKETTNG